jgi:integrase/recombinase XerD
MVSKKGFKTVDVPSWDEVMKCWEYAKRLYRRKKIDLEKLTLLGFILFTGRRLNEILRLKVGDIDLKNEYYKCIVEKKSKSEREDVVRIFPLPRILVPVLREYLKDKTNEEAWLFPSKTNLNLPYPERSARDLVYRLTQKALKRRIRPHAFRHAVAIRMVSKRLPMEYIRRVLAHSSYEPAKWYLNITVQDIKTEFNQALFGEDEI